MKVQSELTVSHYSLSSREELRQGRKLKQARNLEGGLKQKSQRSVAYWITPYGFLSLLSYRAQGKEKSKMDLVLPHQPLTKKTKFIGLPTGQSGGDIFLIDAASPQMTVACVKDKTNQNTFFMHPASKLSLSFRSKVKFFVYIFKFPNIELFKCLFAL